MSSCKGGPEVMGLNPNVCRLPVSIFEQDALALTPPSSSRVSRAYIDKKPLNKMAIVEHMRDE